jgi:hypothetical protein
MGVFAQLHRIEAALFRIERRQIILIHGELAMSKELDDLTAQVQANADLEASAVTLINGLADQIKAAAEDPAKIAALADQIKASAAPLAAAVAANTAPPEPPAPAPAA